jgi:hypothetical protein
MVGLTPMRAADGSLNVYLTLGRGKNVLGGQPVTVVSGTLGSFTTFDPANLAPGNVLSNGDLTVTVSSSVSTYQVARSVTSHSSGKYYYEVTANLIMANYSDVGITTSGAPLNMAIGSTGSNSSGAFDAVSGFFYNNSASGTTPGWAQGDTIGIAVDVGAQLIWLRNTSSPSTWNAGGSANPATGVGGISISSVTGALYAAVSIYSLSIATQLTANFGAASYAASAPSGFGNW